MANRKSSPRRKSGRRQRQSRPRPLPSRARPRVGFVVVTFRAMSSGRGFVFGEGVRRGGEDARSSRPGGRQNERSREVVPRAIRAHLDHVRRELASFLRHLAQFASRRDASPVRRQARAEDIRDMNEVGILADRAHLSGGLAALSSRPPQLRMGVADLVLSQTALAELRDDGLARQAIVDLAGSAGGRTPDGSLPEAHGRPGYSRLLPIAAGKIPPPTRAIGQTHEHVRPR